MPFPGVQAAVTALGARDVIARAGALTEEERQIRARSASALMDRRIADAVMAARKSNAQDKLASVLDMSDPNNIAVIAQLATQMSAAQLARGRGQQNDARQAVLDALQAGIPVSPDTQNAYMSVAGNKLLTPNNVSVAEQAGAALAADNALAEQRGKAADYYDARAKGKVGGSTGSTQVPGTTFALVFGANATKEVPKFLAWQAKMQAENPQYANQRWALGQYLLGQAASAADSGAQPAGGDGKTPATAIPAANLSAAPPAGTWVRLPNGQVRQVQ